MLLLNLPPPVEGIKHRQENTRLWIHQEVYGPGTLYIAERSILVSVLCVACLWLAGVIEDIIRLVSA